MSFDIEFRKQGEGTIARVWAADSIEFSSDPTDMVETIHGGETDLEEGWTMVDAMHDFDVVVVEPSLNGGIDERE